MRNRTNIRQAFAAKGASAISKVLCLIALVAGIAMSWINTAVGQQSTGASGSQQPPLMEREKEVALALSSCPSFLANKAAVMYLKRQATSRLETVRTGSLP